MGKRGPIPKPTALKRAAGNPGRRQLNDHEPIPPAGEISPPAWVSGAALEVWNQLSPSVTAMKTLTTADVLTFARYCVATARYIELQALLWKRGAMGTTYSKRKAGTVEYVYELPQAAELRKLHEILVRLEDRFGLNAAARSRINIQPMGVPAAAPSSEKSAHDERLRLLFAGGGPAKKRTAVG